MSAASDCSCACPTPTVTMVPGSAGENGTDGAAGANGINSFTVLTADLLLPGAAGPVVAVTSVGVSSWASVGQVIFISDGTVQGHFEVLTVPSSTTMTLEWLDYPGDSAGASTITSGATVSPSGVLSALAAALPTALTDNSTGTASNTIAAGVGVFTITIPLTSLATGLSTLAIDLLTALVPGYRFKLLSFDFVTTIVGAGTGASQVFNLEIDATDVTGGVLTVTLASTNTIGAITSGTAITAANVGTAANNASIEMAAGGTAFTSGSGYFVIKLQNMDSADAVAALADHVNDLITSLT